jgi:hypothetical protein
LRKFANAQTTALYVAFLARNELKDIICIQIVSENRRNAHSTTLQMKSMYELLVPTLVKLAKTRS